MANIYIYGVLTHFSPCCSCYFLEASEGKRGNVIRGYSTEVIRISRLFDLLARQLESYVFDYEGDDGASLLLSRYIAEFDASNSEGNEWEFE